MVKKLLWCFFFLISVMSIEAQLPNRGKSDYIMNVKLDTQNKILTGKTTLSWYNPSKNAVKELLFHLYYNAFRNTESTFMKNRADFGFLMKSLQEDCGWSYVTITSIKDEEGNELVEQSEYISPDDGNPSDRTVLRVPLLRPVMSKSTATFTYEWQAKIPKAMIRSGYNQDYYFFAQWFPKLGVYEPAGMRYEMDGDWSCHQYHASGEYYGEFGSYEVTLDVPASFQVGATGVLQSKDITGSRKTLTFYQDSVIDFSWTCSPHFKVFNDQWKDVAIQLYTYPGHEHFADRYFTSAKNALAYMDEHVGKYPYSTLTMVDPPLHGLFTGGMEYPTFISSISSNFFPEGVKAPETLVTHEFVHQYFMQMIATNEQEEPWMDEGITTYYEGRILDEFYGAETSLLDVGGVKLGSKEYNRFEFWSMDNPQIADNSYMARDFIHGGYGTIAYNKTAMMLKTLEGILGQERMDIIMRKYFDTWKFNHPCGRDFTQVFFSELDSTFLVNHKLDLELFFQQALYGTDICEFNIQKVVQVSKVSKGGFNETLDECESYTLSNLKENPTTEVVVERIGGMVVPVDIVFYFKDGKTKQFTWNGRSRSTQYTVEGHDVTKISLDPSFKLDLEQNRLNNTWLAKSSSGYKKYTSKFKVGMQHLLDLLNVLS